MLGGRAEVLSMRSWVLPGRRPSACRVHHVVTMTMCAGKVLMQDRKLLFLDEAEITAKSRELAAKCWKRYSK